MATIIFDETRYTDNAKEILEKMVGYTEGKVPVLLISEEVAVFLMTQDCQVCEELLEIADKQISDVHGYMTDFETWIMNDGNGIVNLTNANVAVIVKKDMIKELDEIPFKLAMEYRFKALQACEGYKRIALYIPD